jgi:fructose-bisphosphate aldolase class I
VYKIQNGTVSELLVQENAKTLAKYAVICQANGLVPIVEPEVLMDGDHDLETNLAVCERANAAVMKALADYHVCWEGMLLKPNFVFPGQDCKNKDKYTTEQCAKATVTMLSRTLPAAVPGVMFLSGGISEVQSSEVLNALNRVQGVPKPWYLGFSYARALQSTALKAWGGKKEGVEAGQKVLLHRAQMNSNATLGKYDRNEDDKTSESLYVKGYVY